MAEKHVWRMKCVKAEDLSKCLVHQRVSSQEVGTDREIKKLLGGNGHGKCGIAVTERLLLNISSIRLV